MTLPSLVIALTTLLGAADETWWAYRPVERPAVPDVAGVEHPIDAFISARLQKNGVAMSEPASRRVLMRRAYLGVIGLPPTLDQQKAFLEDSSPEAWQTLIDQLLASQHYGERWARYWLDVVRYADTNGYERDAEKPSVWKYRDYVIRSLNEDKPYDRFALEQIAGDEIEGVNTETVIATGFWALGTWNDEVDPLELPQYRADELDDLVNTVSQAFLASTISCARCHDHKFDPFTANDYYSLVTFVEPLKRPNSGRTDRSLPAGSPKARRQLADRDQKIMAIHMESYAIWKPHRDAYFKEHEKEFEPSFIEAINAIDVLPNKRHPGQWGQSHSHEKKWNELVITLLSESEIATLATLDARIATLRAQTPDLPHSYLLFEDSPNAPPTHFLERGNPASRGKVMQPAVPAVLTSVQPEFPRPDEFTSRRRLALGRWIASKDNPLTARVIVNRVWQHHFGTGIVSTPSDFGRVGALPTHPLLLDWLAHWFMHDAGWSIKKLHRLILSGHAYQMSSAWNDAAGSKDPENQLLWRFPYRRLDIEAMRDSMLTVSGALNTKMGGRGVQFHVPAVVIEGHAARHAAWSEDPEVERNRRTIYGYVKRSLLVPMIEALDFCDTFRSTARRPITTIAPQSLILFNGEFVNRQARAFAERLRKEAGDDPDSQIDLAYRLTVARSPTPTEAESMRAFLTDESEDPESRDLVQLCRVLLNLNEFVYAD